MSPPTRITKRHTTDSRFYCIERDGREDFYPSVTTILKTVKISGFLDSWREEQSEKIGVLGTRLQLFLDAERGTRVHRLIEEYNNRHMKNDYGSISWGNHTDEEWECFLRYHHWFHETNPKILSIEQTVFSDAHGYAGQLDAIMEIEGNTFIVDFKTSKGVTDDHLLQAAAYAHAYTEMTGIPLDGFLILALRVQTKKGWRDKICLKEEMDRFFEGFQKRKAVFDFENQDFLPRRYLLPESIDPFSSPE